MTPPIGIQKPEQQKRRTTSPRTSERLAELDSQIREIRAAIIGSEMNPNGIAARIDTINDRIEEAIIRINDRVDELEEKQRAFERTVKRAKWILIGGIAAGGAGAGFGWVKALISAITGI